jgi:hypothetical protein
MTPFVPVPRDGEEVAMVELQARRCMRAASDEGAPGAAEHASVTPSFKGKTRCINYMCTKIKLHTRNDSVNTKISATRI